MWEGVCLLLGKSGIVRCVRPYECEMGERERERVQDIDSVGKMETDVEGQGAVNKKKGNR